MFNKSFFWIGLSPILPSLIITLVIVILFKYLPAKLPLFYSIAWGEGQLATQQQFLIIPAVIVLATISNLIISWQLHKSQLFFRGALLISSIIVSIIMTVAFVKIVLMFI